MSNNFLKANDDKNRDDCHRTLENKREGEIKAW